MRFLFLLLPFTLSAEDGYRLWLRFDKIPEATVLARYQKQVTGVCAPASLALAGDELQNDLEGLLGKPIPRTTQPAQRGSVVLATPEHAPANIPPEVVARLQKLDKEGFIIKNINFKGKSILLIGGGGDAGVLYGVFHLLRLLQTQQLPAQPDLESKPAAPLRMLDHWDNLDRTVERGYAGASIWDWHRLPEYLPQQYTDYARANASVGINAVALTNVNANSLVLRPDYLEKAKALADLFRPYGIRVFLTARFNAPMEQGSLPTADPLDARVQQWWTTKVDEIYRLIPDFGGFLVKANSEGQPGPQAYGRTHAEGANLLARALKPHGGQVIWRAFVYSNDTPDDRVTQAYQEFAPLDGLFDDNVIIQIKNGPLDFQPREPIHPLLMDGDLPQTGKALELQITQEYLGQGTHLVFLAPLWKEVLDCPGRSPDLKAVAGVANIGTDRNWTGHLFGQANWYAFGRLAWDPHLTSGQIAGEWTRMTFSNDPGVVETVQAMLLNSREYCVDYMTPLGLAHLMATGHHYGPGPWVDNLSRADWNPVYFHRADTLGIGFDRTARGSNAVAQYPKALADNYDNRATCPESLLLWFHHVGWQERLASGNTLWTELCRHYDRGVQGVEVMRTTWAGLAPKIDAERFVSVRQLLDIQAKEAKWWRDACLAYFQTFSRLPFPEGVEPPAHLLDYYKGLDYPYAPGIKPR